MLVGWRLIPSMMSISPPAGHEGPSGAMSDVFRILFYFSLILR